MMTTIDQIIDALGGKHEAAERFGIQEQSVRKWKRNGLPPEHWPDIVKLTPFGYADLEPLHPKAFKHPETQPTSEA